MNLSTQVSSPASTSASLLGDPARDVRTVDALDREGFGPAFLIEGSTATESVAATRGGSIRPIVISGAVDTLQPATTEGLSMSMVLVVAGDEGVGEALRALGAEQIAMSVWAVPGSSEERLRQAWQEGGGAASGLTILNITGLSEYRQPTGDSETSDRKVIVSSFPEAREWAFTGSP